MDAHGAQCPVRPGSCKVLAAGRKHFHIAALESDIMIERVYPSGRRLARLAIALVLLTSVPVSSQAAEQLRREAEEYASYGWYDIGGMEITDAYCSYASQGLAVDGLDLPGEWIKLKVSFTHGGCYSTRIDYQSAYADTVGLAVRLLDYPVPGEEIRADYTLYDGFGFG